METLYAEAHLEITYAPDTQIMYCRWKGYQTPENIEDGGAVILNLIKDRKIEKILNDNSFVIGPWHHTAGWTHEVWFPAVINAGLKQFAWVLAENMFAAMSAKRAMIPSPVIKSFKTFDDAHNWLLKLPP